MLLIFFLPYLYVCVIFIAYYLVFKIIASIYCICEIKKNISGLCPLFQTQTFKNPWNFLSYRTALCS